MSNLELIRWFLLERLHEPMKDWSRFRIIVTRGRLAMANLDRLKRKCRFSFYQFIVESPMESPDSANAEPNWEISIKCTVVNRMGKLKNKTWSPHASG